jgi:hypothetical protein
MATFDSTGDPQESLNGWGTALDTMRCSRCGGLMVTEQCFDLHSDGGRLGFPVRRCVQCGEVIDPVILRNRYQRSNSDPLKSERG